MVSSDRTVILYNKKADMVQPYLPLLYSVIYDIYCLRLWTVLCKSVPEALHLQADVERSLRTWKAYNHKDFSAFVKVHNSNRL